MGTAASVLRVDLEVDYRCGDCGAALVDVDEALIQVTIQYVPDSLGENGESSPRGSNRHL